MLLVSALAVWKAIVLPNSPARWLAVLLLVLALAMALWHFTRKPQPSRRLRSLTSAPPAKTNSPLNKRKE